MRKVGEAHLEKAWGFEQQQNWVQLLRHANIAATKLKQLKDRRLDTVKLIDEALGRKFNALNFTNRNSKAMECAEERYTLWAMNHLRNPNSIRAALGMIESCLHNREYEDAVRYGHHAMFMIKDMADNFIPMDEQPSLLADVSYYLAVAVFRFAQAGGIPPEEKLKAGEEAIASARQALELHTQLHGTESSPVSRDLGALSQALEYFNNADDDEVLRLREQAIAIVGRVEGSSSVNVAADEEKLGIAYHNRAKRAIAVEDMDRCMANLELGLPHFREALRVYRINNHVVGVENTLHQIAFMEGLMEFDI